MSIKTLVLSVIERFGYAVIPQWRLDDLAFERHLTALFARYGITTVLDVGANIGQYRDFLRNRVGFTGQIHSFEPQPQLAAALEKRAATDPLWTVHHLALGSEDGEVTMHIMERNTFSSIREPDNSLAPQFESSNTVVQNVMVPVRRLDGLNLPGLDSAYLKCDTQGFDMEVMRGAPALMVRLKAVQFELAFRSIYQGVPDYRSVLAEVEGRGFGISGLFPVSSDPELRAVEMDCVMVRSADKAPPGGA